MTRLTASVLTVAVLILTTGCGGPQFSEVEGTLTSKDGQPMNNVRVEFWPDLEGPKSTGVTDAQGRFTLKTEDGRIPGAIVGPHTIVLKDLNAYGNKFYGRKAENMPYLNKGGKVRFVKNYSNPAETELKANVTAVEKNVIDLKVK